MSRCWFMLQLINEKAVEKVHLCDTFGEDWQFNIQCNIRLSPMEKGPIGMLLVTPLKTVCT